MGKIIGLFVVVVALLVGLSVGPGLAETVDDYNSAARRRAEQDLAERRYKHEQQQAWDQATMPGRVASDYGWRLATFAIVGLAAYGATDYYRRRQRRADLDRALISPDARGFLPLPRAMLEAGDSLDADVLRVLYLYQQRFIEEAIHQPGQSPASLHYSPSITHAPAQLTADAAPALPGNTALPLPGVTDLADLLGTFRPAADKVLLGLGPGGKLITVGVKQLCHVALVGATGGGKSNLLRLLLPQLQSLGARIVLADPHFAPIDPESGEDWRPIAQQLHMPPAIHPQTIADLLRWLTEELDRRLGLRRLGEKVGRPLFLAFDELPVITDMVPDAMDAISRILREGRKVHLLTVGASQDMLVKTIGGSSAVRDCYRTAFYVGGDAISASRLLDRPQKQIDDGQLSTGLALLRSSSTQPATMVRVPYASNDAIGILLGTSGAASDPTSIFIKHGDILERREVGAEVDTEVGRGYPLPGQQDATNPRAERVRELLRAKTPMNTVIREVWGVEAGGRAYQQAAEEYRAIVARLVGGAA